VCVTVALLCEDSDGCSDTLVYCHATTRRAKRPTARNGSRINEGKMPAYPVSMKLPVDTFRELLVVANLVIVALS
jgi:hypothetical protein